MKVTPIKSKPLDKGNSASIRQTVQPKKEPIMIIPDSLRQSAKGNDLSMSIANSKVPNREDSPGSKPIAVVFNDKEPTEDNTYNVKDSSTIKNDSMVFDSTLGKDTTSVQPNSKDNGCIMSLCGTSN